MTYRKLCPNYTMRNWDPFEVSFSSLAWKAYTLPKAWTEGDALLCHTLGAVRSITTS